MMGYDLSDSARLDGRRGGDAAFDCFLGFLAGGFAWGFPFLFCFFFSLPTPTEIFISGSLWGAGQRSLPVAGDSADFRNLAECLPGGGKRG